MKVTVVKFGGTSLSTVQKIHEASKIITDRMEEGFRVVGVVSAQGKVTDQLLSDARAITRVPTPRETDMLLTTGERISAALVSLAVNGRGRKAISLTGSQAGIITDDCHNNARIIEIRPGRVVEALRQGLCVIVGGFQGVSFRKEITTLGRGGSDTSAAALAAALGAERCEIFSDVDGVYSADPRIVRRPVRRASLSYSEMIELSRSGAGVLHHAAIEFARDSKIPIVARDSSHPEGPGTIISGFGNSPIGRVAGITSKERLARIQLPLRTPDELGDLVSRLSDLELRFATWKADLRGNRTMSFVIDQTENYDWGNAASTLRQGWDAQVTDNLGTVSVIGEGIGSNSILDQVIGVLQSVPGLESIESAPLRITAVVAEKEVKRLVRRLHKELVEGGSARSNGPVGSRGHCERPRRVPR